LAAGSGSCRGGAPVKGSRREPAERVRLGEGMLVAGSASSSGALSAANQAVVLGSAGELAHMAERGREARRRRARARVARWRRLK
jgi:hypothetical protein